MKTKHLLFAVVMIFTAFTVVAQHATNKTLSAKDNIPFGEKLPPPDLTEFFQGSAGITRANTIATSMQSMRVPGADKIKKTPEYYEQLLLERRKMQTSIFEKSAAEDVKAGNETSLNSNFNLIKDINTLSESNPDNFTNDNFDVSDYPGHGELPFAILNNIIYFIADDGIHGNELWRSDGTTTGTFLFKDFTPGVASSYIIKIMAAGGKIYFMLGSELWVSDGTESSTQALGVYEAGDFFTYSNKLYFIADALGYRSAIWQTDGTIEGTRVIIDLASRNSGGEQLSQPTIVDNILYFTFINYDPFGWQIWRSDLTEEGTYYVGATFPYDNNTVPAQLTAYDNKLYFSANDGNGRKLWVSDGTDAGTKPAPGNHGVIIDADYLGKSFPVVNNVLCVPGEKPSHGNGLYKYDASDGAGLVKIKDFALDGVIAFIIPNEMQVVNNTLYFKVTSYANGIHDELWSSKGTGISTQLVISGEVINNLYIGNGTLYFVKGDRFLGAELWKIFNTSFGSFPIIESDIFKGNPGSYPGHLRAFKGRLIFSAANGQNGNELFITNEIGPGANLVKDINITTTATSLTGYNPYSSLGYTGMITMEKEVLFTAYERVHGKELYKSDGTTAGTQLLNNIVPGDGGFDALLYISKNNAVYFVAISKEGYSIYKTNGTKNSLRKITPDYLSIITFAVADNGIIFYQVYNYSTAVYELWRSDGTTAGTWLLSTTLYTAYYSFLNAVGNTAFFVAGDASHGYELWKSDGSVAGTKLVKDINPGTGDSYPGGMFVFKNEVYFAAFNGVRYNFYKSDGTKSGTILLKKIDPWYARTVSGTERFNFEVSNNILYFSAVDTSNTKGTQLWKTDGTPAGTQVVKDINPNANDFYENPFHLTNVNGTLYFRGNDGVNGTELWKSDGTKEGTHLVKDITPGSAGTFFIRLVGAGGKLFFTAVVNGVQGLWSSDGTPDGTQQITDAGISGVNITEIYSVGDKLIFPGYTSQYGLELYAGTVDDETGKFVASKITNAAASKTTTEFNAVLYPNPVSSNSTLQITGNAKNVSISITDMSGKKIWQSDNSSAKLIKLPVERYAAGVYVVTITNGKENKIIKLVKQ
jgi:ELWxxDGT repeat protein